MAGEKARHLLTYTVNDCVTLRAQLEQAKNTAARITERMLALADAGNPVAYLIAYDGWPQGYTLEDFVALYDKLSALPGSLVDDATRASIYKMIAFFP